MKLFFSDYWWIYLIRGLFAILWGVLALFMPGITFATLVIFLGAFMFVDGIFSIVSAISARRTNSNWGWYLLSGIAGIIIGIITFYNPFLAGTALVFYVAAWALVMGVVEIAAAIRLRRSIKGEGWYILGGILTIVFGILLMLNPIAGALTLTWIFGVYAIVWGVMLTSLSFRLRKRREVSGGHTAHAINVT